SYLHAPVVCSFSIRPRRPPRSPLFPYTTLFRSDQGRRGDLHRLESEAPLGQRVGGVLGEARVYESQPPLLHAQDVPGPLHLLARSEEHTSELQSRENLVCRLLLEKKKKKTENTQ